MNTLSLRKRDALTAKGDCAPHQIAHTSLVRFVRTFCEGDQVTVSGTMQAISETGLDLDMRSTNAEGAACGMGIASLHAHVAMAPALDDVPAGLVEHWTMLMIYTADSPPPRA